MQFQFHDAAAVNCLAERRIDCRRLKDDGGEYTLLVCGVDEDAEGQRSLLPLGQTVSVRQSEPLHMSRSLDKRFAADHLTIL